MYHTVRIFSAHVQYVLFAMPSVCVCVCFVVVDLCSIRWIFPEKTELLLLLTALVSIQMCFSLICGHLVFVFAKKGMYMCVCMCLRVCN